MRRRKLRKNLGIAVLIALLGAAGAGASLAAERFGGPAEETASWWNALWEGLPSFDQVAAWLGLGAPKDASATLDEAPSTGTESAPLEPVDAVTTSSSEEEGDSDFNASPDPHG